MVKALDSKSNGIFPRRFEPCSQREDFYNKLQFPQNTVAKKTPISKTSKVWSLKAAKYRPDCCQTGCDGRVVKALDLKSNGIFPRRFEPCSQRDAFLSSWCSAGPLLVNPNSVLMVPMLQLVRQTTLVQVFTLRLRLDKHFSSRLQW